ncbi:MAG: STAS domain-containing protein [Candidatus Auribacterota bacterium]
MGIRVNKNDKAVILNVLDDVILDTVQEIQNEVNILIKERLCCIVMDLSAIEFITSRGLGAVGKAMDALRKQGGDLKLCGLKPEVRGIFDICGLAKIIDIYDNPGDAVNSFGASVSAVEKRLLWSIKPHEDTNSTS